MRTAPDCLPCLLRQTIAAARQVTTDEAVHRRLAHQTLGALASLDFDQPPVAAVQTIQRLLRRATGCTDPYLAAKTRYTQLALERLPRLRRRIDQANDPFAAAVRLAIAGNIIDLGAWDHLNEEVALAALTHAFDAPFHGDVEALRRAASGARHILYLTDNAGEIVLDRLLIERLPLARVTVAVRGGPVLNDATLADARAASLDSLVRVIDNGSDAPGTLLPDCSPAFLEVFHRADLIIAKGQGNFETLADITPGAFFLFQVKCRPIAGIVHGAPGDLVVWRAPQPAKRKLTRTRPR